MRFAPCLLLAAAVASGCATPAGVPAAPTPDEILSQDDPALSRHVARNELTYGGVAGYGASRGNATAVGMKEERAGAELIYYVNPTSPCPFDLSLELLKNGTLVDAIAGRPPIVGRIDASARADYAYNLRFTSAAAACALTIDIHYFAPSA